MLIDAPIHAILMNDVDVGFVDHVNEEDVKVHPVANPVVQTQMLEAIRKLSEHWGEENFDAMCRDFENQETAIPSGSHAEFVSQTIRRPGSPPKSSRTTSSNSSISPKRNLANIASSSKASRVSALPGGEVFYMAAKFLTAKERIQNYSYDFDRDGHARSTRMPRGEPVTIEAHGFLWIPVLKGNSEGEVKRNFREFNQQWRELVENVMKDVQVVVTLSLNVKEMIRRDFSPEFVIFDEASFSGIRKFSMCWAS